MRDELSQTAATIATHPKTAVLVAGFTGFNRWWIEWGTPVFDVITSVLGVILVCILIRYHWQNTKKIIRENKEKEG